jgi:hypothetical protein
VFIAFSFYIAWKRKSAQRFCHKPRSRLAPIQFGLLDEFVEQCLANRQGRSKVDKKGYQEAITEAGEKIVAQEQTEDQAVACLNCCSTYFPSILFPVSKIDPFVGLIKMMSVMGILFAFRKHFVIVD